MFCFVNQLSKSLQSSSDGGVYKTLKGNSFSNVSTVEVLRGFSMRSTSFKCFKHDSNILTSTSEIYKMCIVVNKVLSLEIQ